MASSVNLYLLVCFSLIMIHRSSAASSLCPRLDLDFVVAGLRSQCPLWIERSSATEVSGDTLDRELGHGQSNVYYSVLFYGSWCPFSSRTRSIFDVLSSMFPQITHLAVEESSAMPSVFSRYGIRSFPSIVMANATTRVQYHGSKNLNSLVHFYKDATGIDPVAYFAVEQPTSSGITRPLSPWDQSPREIIKSEPYLAFSLLFICLKAFIHFFPVIASRFKAFLAAYALHLNLGIFGEWHQLLERVLHVINIKRLWSKLRLCNKARNFQKGAKNARVWASSLASVSLGESSSSRNSS